jgi:hypothetical protein
MSLPPYDNKKIYKILTVVFFGLAIVFICSAVYTYFSFRIPSYYVHTYGRVISEQATEGYQVGKGHQPVTEYYPTIGFKVNGVSYKFTAGQSAGGGGPVTPDASTYTKEVAVVYNPADPSNSAKLASYNGVGGTIGLLILSFIMLLLSSLVLVKSKNKHVSISIKKHTK